MGVCGWGYGWGRRGCGQVGWVIIGIGIDFVDILWFECMMVRIFCLCEWFFVLVECELCFFLFVVCYVVKEVLIKVLGGFDGVYWIEIEIVFEVLG